MSVAANTELNVVHLATPGQVGTPAAICNKTCITMLSMVGHKQLSASAIEWNLVNMVGWIAMADLVSSVKMRIVVHIIWITARTHGIPSIMNAQSNKQRI